MKILVLGAGQVGSTLVEYLSEDHDMTVVDLAQDQLLALQNRFDIRTVVGSASYPHILENAGAADADLLLAVTSSDESNIVACQMAHCLFKTPVKIARVRCREIANYPDLFAEDKLAIDYLIDPAVLATQRLKRQIEHPGTAMVLDFLEGAVQLAAVRATPPSELIGHKLLELYQDLDEIRARIVGILRGNEFFVPDNDTVIEAHDEVFFCTQAEHTNQVMQSFLKKNLRYRRIMIAGAGNIGSGLAKELEFDYNIKMIERNAAQCEMAAEALQNTVVLNGSASDAELLTNENIDEVDLFCSLTNDDEANIMAAIVAKRLGARSTIALVNRQTYAHYLIERSPDIDMALSPQQVTVGRILTFLRQGDMINVYRLPHGSAEAIELVAHGDPLSSKIIGRSIEKAKLPSSVAVCALMRGKEIFIADPSLEIQVGDRVVLLVTDKSAISTVEKLFKGN